MQETNADPLEIIPFRFLRTGARDALRPALTLVRFTAGDVLVHAGDDDDRVFLLTAGEVAVVDPANGVPRSVIEAGHYFGERAALFAAGRAYDVRALTEGTVFTLPGERFLALCRDEPTFATALGNILRIKQGIFHAFDRFLAELDHGASEGRLSLGKLVELYRDLKPALHRGASEDAIDFAGLTYAVRRLPDNLTRTFAWFLTDDVPYHLVEAPFPSIPTSARRRTVSEMLRGKNMVVLRDGLSDLVDLVTCLCLYILEARKIRRRIDEPQVLAALAAGTTTALPLSDEEAKGIERLWPEEPRQRLLEIAAHHEDFSITLRKQRDNYNSAHAEHWTREVARATRELLGVDPHALDVPVHVVSSNTHSVTNCLSPYLREHGSEILAWGRAHEPGLTSAVWHDERDLVVALLRPFLAANQGAAQKMRERDAEGVVALEETAFTGIGVQLVDTARRPIGERPNVPARRSLIVNVDFAFGQQAQQIVGALIALFGPAIRGIHVLGKAGGLLGERGDVMLATSLLEQRSEQLLALPPGLDVGRLRALLPGRGVHAGPVLTVMGTLLQNATMLHFYRHVWGAVGLEMEGTWFAREIAQAQQARVLRPDVAQSFVYYTSDLPLRHDANLAEAMRPSEGIPPLYAITREILRTIDESG